MNRSKSRKAKLSRKVEKPPKVAVRKSARLKSKDDPSSGSEEDIEEVPIQENPTRRSQKAIKRTSRAPQSKERKKRPVTRRMKKAGRKGREESMEDIPAKRGRSRRKLSSSEEESSESEAVEESSSEELSVPPKKRGGRKKKIVEKEELEKSSSEAEEMKDEENKSAEEDQEKEPVVKKKGGRKKKLVAEEEKTKPKKKRGQKKKAEPVEAESEKSEDEMAEEEEQSKPAKKRGRKKKTESESQEGSGKIKKKREGKRKVKEPKPPKPKKERPKKFRRGKWNPDITLITIDEDRESLANTLNTSCCAGCSNRNIIRAVLTNNRPLLKSCISSIKLSSLFDSWGPEIHHNSFHYALCSNNLNLMVELLKASHSPGLRANNPTYLIKYLDTGMVCQQAFGVRVRKVQLARGNRQGNNAFLEKYFCNTAYNEETIKKMLTNQNIKKETLARLMALEPGISFQLYNSIIQAIISGNRKVAAFLISQIKGLTNYGFGNLHYEVLVLDTEDLAEFHKASVHKKTIGNDQVTPTHCACVNPNPKYLQALLDADPNVQIMDEKNRKPVHYAAACEGPGPLELLIAQGGNVNDLDSEKKSTLHYAAMYGRAENLKIIARAAPMLLKAKDKSRMMPLHYACKNGHLEAVKAFIEVGANVNIGSGNARLGPLGFAAAYNHYEICEYLINNKARIMHKDKFKRTPLAMAVRNGNAKVASLLLQHGAIWDEPDSSGNTPLHYAAAYGWTQCAELLIKAGANVNANSSWKISPLNIAMLKNHYGMVKFLLSQPGIDVNCKDEKGRTLVSLAVELDNDEALEYIEYLLKEKGADPNISDIKGLTPLHYLLDKKISVNSYIQSENRYMNTEEYKQKIEEARNHRKQVISLLTTYGAKIDVVDANGRSLFEACLLNGNYDLLETFIESATFAGNSRLLFAFSEAIYSPVVKAAFDMVMKKAPPTAADINMMDDQGFTPFLKFLKDFLSTASNNYKTIYSYVEFELKRLKYQGETDFSKEKFNIHYENYMEYNQNSNGNPENGLIQSYFITQSDKQFAAQLAQTEFKTTFISVILSVLKQFLDLGADPKAKVGKLLQYRGPSPYSHLIPSQSEPAQPVFGQLGNLPGLVLQLAQPFIQSAMQPEVPKMPEDPLACYGANGVKSAWHFVAINPVKEVIEFLEPLGIPIDDGDMHGDTPFMHSLNLKQSYPYVSFEDLYSFFKKYKVNIDKPNSKGVTPFLMLMKRGEYSFAYELLKDGANVNASDDEGNFALKIMVTKNDLNQVKLLLTQYKADPNKHDLALRTALHIAINQSSPMIDSTSDLESLLMEHGAEVNAIDARGRTPLHYAFVKFGRWDDNTVIDPIETVTTLCSNPNIKVDVQDEWGKTPLHYAAQRSSTICSVFLLNRGADIEKKNKYGNTPLAVAFLNNHPDYAITLIERNADVSQLVFPEETNRHGSRYGTNKSVTDSEQSMFRIGIRLGWQGLLYLLLDKNYDYMRGMEDALTEKKYHLLLKLLKKTAKDEVVQRFNDKKQNLFHVLARYGTNMSIDFLNEIYSQFSKRGVKHMAVDVYGRTALHYAVENNNYPVITLLLKEKYDPSLMDKNKHTAVTLAIKGRKITSASMERGEVLHQLLNAGANLNVLYYEPYYISKDNGKDNQQKMAIDSYKTTPLIHLVRYMIGLGKSSYKKYEKVLISFFQMGADASILDSDHRDIFMYLAKENAHELLNTVLFHVRNHLKNAVDKVGKTAMHYAVAQYEIGSYQNSTLVEMLLAASFNYTIKDLRGFTPLDYAVAQPNGKLAKVFMNRAIDISKVRPVPFNKKSTSLSEWKMEVDFAKDSDEYLKNVQEALNMQAKEQKAEVDSVGNEGEPLEVIYDSKNEPYECYMTKVDVKNGTYGEYLFYRMQLIRNTNRDVYMVYTRWGRIGETGMYQKTPLADKEEAAKEFEKIFKSKSGNEWSDRHNFVKQKHKYVPTKLKKKGLMHQQLLRPFNYKAINKVSTLPKKLQKLMKLIVDISIYEKALTYCGIHTNAFSTMELEKESLLECQEILEDLKKVVGELDKERSKGLQANLEFLEEKFEQVNELSGKYYELFPQQQYSHVRPPPLDNFNLIKQQLNYIYDLLNIATASKILLGAQSKLDEIHPWDYCYKALGVNLELLPKDTEEYEILLKYVKKSTKSYGNQSWRVKRIFRAERRGEYERFQPFEEKRNRWLLFHGSKTSNFVGILSQGLRVAPPEVAMTGWAFGRGIYFADMFAKSAGYCYTYSNDGKEKSKLMLMCEVALGKMKKPKAAMFDQSKLEEKYDSMQAVGRRSPDPKGNLHLNDGMEIPLGDIVENDRTNTTALVEHNEFIVFKPEQIKMRYLIQWV